MRSFISSKPTTILLVVALLIATVHASTDKAATLSKKLITKMNKLNKQSHLQPSFLEMLSTKDVDMGTDQKFKHFEETGVMDGDDDPLSQVRSVIGNSSSSSSSSTSSSSTSAKSVHVAASADQVDVNADNSDLVSLVEVESKVSKVRSYCEICILVMQMKERGQPHLCAGLNSNYYITCVEVLESLLRADKALVYWLKNGCMHMDVDGPEIVRPCPALNICSWVPNLFSTPPFLVRDGVESLCPKDNKFLPTIPQEYRNMLPK